jgi:voltage-gated potassium channel
LTNPKLLTDGQNEAGSGRLRQWLFIVIFKADTRGGKLFDVLLLLAIVLSVLAVMLSTVNAIAMTYRQVFVVAELIFTILFTLEYLARLYCVKNAGVYARSFYGVVDVLSVLPTYLELMVTGASYMLVIRIFRILRVFRVLKLTRYVGEADALMEALTASRRKIFVFLYAIVTLVVIFGSLMYLIEGPQRGFTSIPRGVYWSIVTLTTVGYGDITPTTPLGQALSAVIMIMGYGIIAVPTGIYASELTHVIQRRRQVLVCPSCQLVGHEDDASFCKRCGTNLSATPADSG